MDRIDKSNIDAESYYNVVQISQQTRLANPVAAAKNSGYAWDVTRDKCGNVLIVVCTHANVQPHLDLDRCSDCGELLQREAG